MKKNTNEPAPAFILDRCAPAAIAQAAWRALIAEVTLTPKPGLVDRNNTGAHKDMTLAMFHASANALLPHFEAIAHAGRATANASPSEAFAQIRPLGILAERDMLLATGGANTHKGAIFSLGLLTAAGSRLAAQGKAFDSGDILASAGGFAAGICARELSFSQARTKGERAYIAYGARGARGEAEAGFPSLRDIALPALKQTLLDGYDTETALLVTLLHLMAQVRDTNVMTRADIAAAAFVRGCADALIKKGLPVASPAWKTALYELDCALIARNVSPGGCADLLACAHFVYSITEAAL